MGQHKTSVSAASSALRGCSLAGFVSSCLNSVSSDGSATFPSPTLSSYRQSVYRAHTVSLARWHGGLGKRSQMKGSPQNGEQSRRRISWRHAARYPLGACSGRTTLELLYSLQLAPHGRRPKRSHCPVAVCWQYGRIAFQLGECFIGLAVFSTVQRPPRMDIGPNPGTHSPQVFPPSEGLKRSAGLGKGLPSLASTDGGSERHADTQSTLRRYCTERTRVEDG